MTFLIHLSLLKRIKGYFFKNIFKKINFPALNHLGTCLVGEIRAALIL